MSILQITQGRQLSRYRPFFFHHRLKSYTQAQHKLVHVNALGFAKGHRQSAVIRVTGIARFAFTLSQLGIAVAKVKRNVVIEVIGAANAYILSKVGFCFPTIGNAVIDIIY